MEHYTNLEQIDNTLITENILKTRSRDTLKTRSKKTARHNHLTDTIALERNLLKVPLCVPHAAAAQLPRIEFVMSQQEENGEFYIPKFRMENSLDDTSTTDKTRLRGLPLPQHALVMDVFVSLFARNPNVLGEVWFSYSEVLRILDLPEQNNKVIKEAIRRYHFNPCYFEKCWTIDKNRMTSQGFLIIEKTDLFDPDAEGKNPGRSRQKENLHYIKFSQPIIDSVMNKHIRIFPKCAFTKIEAGTYSLYKIFYGYTDQRPIIRTLDYIANWMHWGDRRDRLRVWVAKQLEELKAKDFVAWWSYKKENDCYEVKCNPAKDTNLLHDLDETQPMIANARRSSAAATKRQARLLGSKIEKSTEELKTKVVKLPKKKSKKVTYEDDFMNMLMLYLDTLPDADRPAALKFCLSQPREQIEKILVASALHSKLKRKK